MDKKQRELEALVVTQKEQLTRYEKRLKDVVTAYKGLLKEKEALETSLTALNSTKDIEHATAPSATESTDGSKPSTNKTDNGDVGDASSAPSDVDFEKGQLQTQIITLMNSLATLSAEKSRMEASFQADKKQLRNQIAQKEQTIQELHMKSKENAIRAKQDVDEVKAKWIIERQDREKETNNQMLMIRELQKLYADERHLKENIEMQLNNFKTQFASNEAENSRLRELQSQLRDAKAQLKQFVSKSTSDSPFGGESAEGERAVLLKQVHQEMQQLKEQHAVAIQQEQRRALRAEDESRKQAALHEDRVANLEARLAELSNTVGNYDRLRQQDQHNIQLLKQQLQELSQTQAPRSQSSQITKLRDDTDIGSLIDEIVRLKNLLTSENARSSNPLDLSKVLAVNSSTSANSHVQCEQQLHSVQQLLENNKIERATLEEKINLQKSHIQTLQEKVKVLNRNIDEAEQELKQQGDKLRLALKAERTKWQDLQNEQENESRCKINELEQQLQNQRQRSLQLLDEKEQEIKALQTSFEIFHNAGGVSGSGGGGGGATTMLDATSNNEYDICSSDADSVENNSNARDQRVKIKSKKLSLGENCHMLHYANELARKDIEITSLRKSKYAAESALRKAIQEKVTAQQEMHEQIEALDEQVDRLQRCKTREGANLEYLKNVIISFIVTKDAEGKRHMLNAISAVLQLTNAEMQTIHNAFQK